MLLGVIQQKFQEMGARADVAVRAVTVRDRFRRKALPEYTIDVNERRKETFELFVSPEASTRLDMSVPCLDRSARHLILAVRKGPELTQFLCGHDERHWFVAALPRNVSSIREAMESLKPEAAALSQRLNGVRPKDRNKRRNAGYIRQGEWFFVPASGLENRMDLLVHRDEPLRRGQGKPHRAQFLCRMGGETVYVNRNHQEGLTEEAYSAAIKAGEQASSFFLATRDAAVYVKGKIAHPDHKTVELSTWHRVIPNAEAAAEWRPQMVFLD